MSIESVMPSNHLILCHTLLLLPSIFPSIRVSSNNGLFASRDQNIGASASTSVLPMNIQGLFPLGLTGLISLQSKRFSRVFSTTIRKHQFCARPLYMTLENHTHYTFMHDSGNTTAFTLWTFVDKVMSLLFIALSRFVIAFFPRSRHLFISWLATVILEPKKIKTHHFLFFHFYSPQSMGPDAVNLVKCCFKPAFSLSSFILNKKLFSSSWLSAISMVSYHLRLLMFLPAILISACDSPNQTFHIVPELFTLIHLS